MVARRLGLGGWHVNHAVDVLDPRGSLHQLVLRRWARAGWEEDDPDYTAEREARVLELLRASAVPAPEVLAADLLGASCGVPALLLSRLVGRPPHPAVAELEGFCRQLADTLAAIHDLGGIAEGRLEPYRLYYDREHASPVAWLPATRVWIEATEAVRETPPPTPMTLIHRDYHPDNTLWFEGLLTGVVDWTQASWGPPALDLGHMRWNLVADYGQSVADRFLACYQSITGHPVHEHPYWDLLSLLDLLLDGDEPGDIDPADLRRFEDYARALLRLMN